MSEKFRDDESEEQRDKDRESGDTTTSSYNGIDHFTQVTYSDFASCKETYIAKNVTGLLCSKIFYWSRALVSFYYIYQ